jgi:hypothetical protein
MSHTVVLHIGAMKSGTSFVQRTLGGNRDELARQGYLFPGRAWRHQVYGVMDVLDQERDGRKPPATVGAWKRLLEEMAGHDGVSVISMEFLAATPPADIARVVTSLAPARVEVVLTARDLGRNIPAMWQEGLKNRSTWTWEEYLDGVEHGDPNEPGVARRFWRHMGTAVIARRWQAAVGRDHFTLVTLPHSGAPQDELWRRFCSVVGLDPAPFELPGRENASLGAASALLLRSVNEHLAGAPNRQYNKVIKKLLAKQAMATRRPQEDPIGFPRARWLDDRAERMIGRLRDLDVRVVGDLEDLRPEPVPGVDPSTVSPAQREEAAVAALGFLVEVWSASQTAASTDK